MTSSEGPPIEQTPVVGTSLEGPPAPPEASKDVTVLAQGHLHPGVLFLRLLSALRQVMVPLLIGLLATRTSMGPFFLVMAGFLFLWTMGYALVIYLTFQYQLTSEELVTRQGILHRQERRIPVNRIQDVSFEQSIVRRFLGLVVVTVETASGEGAEARMDSLGLREAATLREALQLQRRSRKAGAGVVAADGSVVEPEPPQEHMLFKTSIFELVLRGLTDNRAGAILVGIFLLLDQADGLGMSDSVFGWVSGLWEQFNTTQLILLSVAFVFLVFLLGWLVSVVASILLFFDFQLVARDDVFQRRYGLFTTRVRSLPERKIQRVLLQQTWLRRLIGMAVVRADSAGSGANDRQEQKGGLDICVPLTRLPMGRTVVGWLLPGLRVDLTQWCKVSRKVVQRMTLQGVTFGLVLVTIGWWFVGWWALLGLLTPLVAWVLGLLLYHNLGYAHQDDHFAMRFGYLGRYRAYIPLKKVQAVILRAGPEDRLFGLARLSVHVAGCGPTTLPHLTRADAERLQQELAEAAARARFVW